MTLRVQRAECRTCIYRPDFPLNLSKLEAACYDDKGQMIAYRTCHCSEDAVCSGFWARYEDRIPEQLRSGVVFVVDDASTTVRAADAASNPSLRRASRGVAARFDGDKS